MWALEAVAADAVAAAGSAADGAAVAAHNGSASNEIHCNSMCPTVGAYPGAWPLWLLVLSYVSTLVASAAVLIHSRDWRWDSIKNHFLWLHMVFCLVRIFTFSVPLDWNWFWLMLIDYSLPLFFQFAIFSLLIVFLIKCLLLMQGMDRAIRTVLYPVTVVCVLAAGAGCVGISIVIDHKKHKESTSEGHRHGFDHGISMYSAVVFGCLALIVGVIGYKTNRMLMRIILSPVRRQKVRGVTRIVIVYVVVFSLRCLWGLTYSFNVNEIQKYMNRIQSKSNLNGYYVSMLLFYAVFELLPMSILLYTFWQWTPATFADGTTAEDHVPLDQKTRSSGHNSFINSAIKPAATAHTPLLIPT